MILSWRPFSGTSTRGEQREVLLKFMAETKRSAPLPNQNQMPAAPKIIPADKSWPWDGTLDTGCEDSLHSPTTWRPLSLAALPEEGRGCSAASPTTAHTESCASRTSYLRSASPCDHRCLLLFSRGFFFGFLIINSHILWIAFCFIK